MQWPLHGFAPDFVANYFSEKQVKEWLQRGSSIHDSHFVKNLGSLISSWQYSDLINSIHLTKDSRSLPKAIYAAIQLCDTITFQAHFTWSLVSQCDLNVLISYVIQISSVLKGDSLGLTRLIKDKTSLSCFFKVMCWAIVNYSTLTYQTYSKQRTCNQLAANTEDLQLKCL